MRNDPDKQGIWSRLEHAVVGTLFVASMAASLFGCAQQAFGTERPAPLASGRAFICTPLAVWDGDGPIWCAEGPRLRLANITARELNNSCRSRANCPSTSGIAARDALVTLLGGSRGQRSTGHVIVSGPALTCTSNGPDRYDRTLAICRDRLGDIGDRLIKGGFANRW